VESRDVAREAPNPQSSAEGVIATLAAVAGVLCAVAALVVLLPLVQAMTGSSGAGATYALCTHGR
jgi:hypothetical protein